MIEIERVGCEYAAVLSVLHKACFDEGWTPTMFAELLQNPACLALLAQRPQTQPCGFLVAQVVDGDAEIITIGVISDERRSGVGECLVKCLRKEVHALEKLFIEVDVNNLPAVAFYEKLKFAPIGRRKHYYQHRDGVQSDALTMSLVLG